MVHMNILIQFNNEIQLKEQNALLILVMGVNLYSSANVSMAERQQRQPEQQSDQRQRDTSFLLKTVNVKLRLYL